MPDQSPSEERQRLSQTMRIDLTPDAVGGPAVPGKPTRIVTKRMKRRVPTAEMRPPKVEVRSIAPMNSDFEQLLQSVYDAAVITDMDGKIVDANDRATAFLQHTKEELQAIGIADIIYGADESTITRISTNLVERFVLIEMSYCVRKDGSFFPAEIAVNQLRLSEHDFLCFFIRDITLRKQTEERLQIEHTAIQFALSGIAITDMDGKIQYANPAAYNMWGYLEPELEGTEVRILWEGQAEDDNLVQAVVNSPEQTWWRERTAVRKDQGTFNLQVSSVGIRDNDGNMVGLAFSFFDISDRKRAEQALRETERHKVMLESLGTACHHLGQPATVLLANLGIMQRKTEGGSDSDLNSLVGSCLGAAESLSEILHKLNAVNEYRTTPYLDDAGGAGPGNRILEI